MDYEINVGTDIQIISVPHTSTRPLGSLNIREETADKFSLRDVFGRNDTVIEVEFPEDTVRVDGVAVTSIDEVKESLRATDFFKRAGAGGAGAAFDPAVLNSLQDQIDDLESVEVCTPYSQVSPPTSNSGTNGATIQNFDFPSFVSTASGDYEFEISLDPALARNTTGVTMVDPATGANIVDFTNRLDLSQPNARLHPGDPSRTVTVTLEKGATYPIAMFSGGGSHTDGVTFKLTKCPAGSLVIVSTDADNEIIVGSDGGAFLSNKCEPVTTDLTDWVHTGGVSGTTTLVFGSAGVAGGSTAHAFVAERLNFKHTFNWRYQLNAASAGGLDVRADVFDSGTLIASELFTATVAAFTDGVVEFVPKSADISIVLTDVRGASNRDFRSNTHSVTASCDEAVSGTVRQAVTAFTTTDGVDVKVGEFYTAFPDDTTSANEKALILVEDTAGLFQVGKRHTELTGINNTTVPTGHVLTQTDGDGTGLTLRMQFVDAANGHAWNPIEIDVATMIARDAANPNTVVDSSATVFDNDYVQIFLEDADTGTLRFVDVGRQVSYLWSELRLVAQKAPSRRVGEFTYAKSGRTPVQGYLAVNPGTVVNGALNFPAWSEMYPEFVNGNDIVFPADVADMFLRNVGGNAAVEGVFQADRQARSPNNPVSTNVNNGNGNTVRFVSTAPETNPNNRAYQLYAIVDTYRDVVSIEGPSTTDGDPYFGVFSKEGPSGGTSGQFTVNVNGTAVTYENLVNSTDQGSGLLQLNAGTNSNWNSHATTVEKLECGEYIEFTKGQTSNFHTEAFAISNSFIDAAQVDKGNLKIVFNQNNHILFDGKGTELARTSDATHTWRFTRHGNGFVVHIDGVEVYRNPCIPKAMYQSGDSANWIDPNSNPVSEHEVIPYSDGTFTTIDANRFYTTGRAAIPAGWIQFTPLQPTFSVARNFPVFFFNDDNGNFQVNSQQNINGQTVEVQLFITDVPYELTNVVKTDNGGNTNGTVTVTSLQHPVSQLWSHRIVLDDPLTSFENYQIRGDTTANGADDDSVIQFYSRS